MSVANHVVLITGATAGIGAATAEAFAAAGAHLALFSRSSDKVRQFGLKLHAQYPSIRIHFAAVDVGNAQQVKTQWTT